MFLQFSKLSGAIEFAGTICAGKMTVVEAVKKELAKSGSSIQVIAEDLTIQSKMISSYSNHYERQVLLANLITAELIKSRDRLLLVHRGLYDAVAFMRAYIQYGLVEEISALSQINAWRVSADKLINLVVLVKTPAEVAFARARKKFFTLFQMKTDPIFDKNFFEILEGCYTELEKEIPPQKLIVINGGGELSPWENAEIILERLSDFFSRGDCDYERSAIKFPAIMGR